MEIQIDVSIERDWKKYPLYWQSAWFKPNHEELIKLLGNYETEHDAKLYYRNHNNLSVEIFDKSIGHWNLRIDGTFVRVNLIIEDNEERYEIYGYGGNDDMKFYEFIYAQFGKVNLQDRRL